MQKAVIYCRVSSERQVNEGHGLNSQEKRCRDFANNKGYKVVKAFYDEGVSGGLFERPAMKNLINYLDTNVAEQFVIIFDDLARFARDVKVHIQLKSELVSRGAKLECLNFNFDDSEESEYAELVLAAGNQYQRKQNRRSVIQKMKARVEAGYWPFCYPPGLTNIRHPLHGKLLTPHEPKASIFKETIEAFRDGQLNTLEDTQSFINKKYKEHNINEEISISGVDRVLKNILYAGWIEYKPWGVPLQKGKHEGFITKETYDAVQEKLASKSKAPLRRDYNLDFPLRGFVVCSLCKKPVTASWHKGRSGKKYAHYFCKQWGCPGFGKVVRKEIIEPKFETLISGLTPNKDVINLAKAILMDIWHNRDKVEEGDRSVLMAEIEEIGAKKRQFMERIGKTSSEELIKEYEGEIEKLLVKKKELEKKLPTKIYETENFGTAYDLVMTRIERPIQMWQSENYRDKRLLLEMYFEQKLAYDLKTGFGTADLACLVKLITTKEASKNHLVEMGGVEPPSEKTLV